MRFRLTDGAERLALAKPHLCQDDAALTAQIETLGRPATALELQQQLRDDLVTLGSRNPNHAFASDPVPRHLCVAAACWLTHPNAPMAHVTVDCTAAQLHCERATVWLVNHNEERLWNVASTQLGNSILSIHMTHGLSGRAATSRTDVIENNAQQSSDFLGRIDAATAFVTRSVLCVVLLEAESTATDAPGGPRTRAVIQLMNKTKPGNTPASEGAPPPAVASGADAPPAHFTQEDVELVREEAGPRILQYINGISLHQLLTRTSPANKETETSC